MPKHILICCDGTGNKFGERTSNVIRLCDTLSRDATQVAYDHPGVGTMGARNRLTRIGRWWTRILGM
jgi:uncharacterized protein (DUF2235 family)